MPKELKPCPFCGADAEIDTHQAYRNLSTGRVEDAVAVYCIGECGTQMTRCLPDFPGTSRGDLAATLVELWNTRAEQASQPQEILDRITLHNWTPEGMATDPKEGVWVEYEQVRLLFKRS